MIFYSSKQNLSNNSPISVETNRDEQMRTLDLNKPPNEMVFKKSKNLFENQVFLKVPNISNPKKTKGSSPNSDLLEFSKKLQRKCSQLYQEKKLLKNKVNQL